MAIVGPSGSGKSTLLHVFAAVEQPSEGNVVWPSLGPRENLRPREIAVVFQTPSLLAPLTVLENVAFPLLLCGSDETSAIDAARSALQELHLGGLEDRLPHELSGGQAQRVAMARVLAVRPALILADEPTGQLDYATGTDMLDVLDDALTKLGATLILSTHDERVAQRFTTRWTMKDGSLLETAA